MSGSLASVHTGTPVISACDPRGLPVRAMDFHCDAAGGVMTSHVHRCGFDTAGRLLSASDPRLGSAVVSLRRHLSLSGEVLLSEHVDAGWRLILSGAAGEGLVVWDGAGQSHHSVYDDALRPIAVSEQGADGKVRVIERLTYGGTEQQDHNGCGRLVRHDDPAGSVQLSDYGVRGELLSEARRFLLTLDDPDWPEDIDGRDALLEDESAVTRRRLSASGEPLQVIDAGGNTQRFGYDLAGHRHQVSLHLSDGQTHAVLTQTSYTALDQTEQETAGNGVVTQARYCPFDGRLLHLEASRPGEAELQRLSYRYDPVGNVTAVEDLAQAPVFFRNQQVDAVCTYQYDSLYQLIEATGFESVQPEGWRGLAGQFVPRADAQQLANYREQFTYDAAGNLQTLIHSGAQSYTRRTVTSATSNRSLLAEDDWLPGEGEIAERFDANGNLLEVARGQRLLWDARNKLRQVKPVVRDSGDDDSEHYVYDADGRRVRKVRQTKADNQLQSREVRYLPGIEKYSDSNGANVWHVLDVQTGLGRVSWTVWVQGTPPTVKTSWGRYVLADHLGSATVELDESGMLISREHYYPFGGTTVWTAVDDTSARFKTRRYSGKEQDASGLYDYGLRYYAPWLGRWINPDPGGDIDGLNRYRFVRNNPSTMPDLDGRMPRRSSVVGSTDTPPTEPTLTLLYGFSDARDAYLDELGPQEDTDLVRIDSMNEVIGIDFPSVTEDYFGVFQRIRGRLQPDDAAVERFREELKPYYRGSAFDAARVLMSWAGYLSTRADELDIAAKLAAYRASGDTEKLGQFWKKNSIHDLAVDQVEKFTEDYFSRPSSFLRNAQREVREIVASWVFRRTSKLALDWVHSDASHAAHGVWFLDVIKQKDGGVSQRVNLDKQLLKQQKYKGLWGEASVREPVTYSEARHMSRMGYHKSGKVRFVGIDEFRKTLNWRS